MTDSDVPSYALLPKSIAAETINRRIAVTSDAAIPVSSGKTCIDFAKNNPIDNPAPIENKHIVPVRMNGELSCSEGNKKKMSVVVNIKPSPVLFNLSMPNLSIKRALFKLTKTNVPSVAIWKNGN